LEGTPCYAILTSHTHQTRIRILKYFVTFHDFSFSLGSFFCPKHKIKEMFSFKFVITFPSFQAACICRNISSWNFFEGQNIKINI
jgi:hypothetical protein